MSFIAFDLDALNAAPAVARAAGVTENDVLGGLLRLWAWCFRTETDIVSALQLRGHFGVDAGPALEAFGFLAKIDEGWRVRGAERYLKVKASQRSAAARTNARRASATPDGGPSVDRRSTDAPPPVDPSVSSRPSPNTEHRTPEEKNVRTVTVDAAKLDQLIEAHVAQQPKKRRACEIIDTTGEPEPERVPVVAGPVVYEKPTTDPELWSSAEEFWAWAQAKRQEAGLIGERERPRGLSAWWSTARQTTSAASLLASFEGFMREEHWQKATPPNPFRGFLKQWERWVPRQAPKPPARLDGDVWAELRGRVFELDLGHEAGLVAQQLEQLHWSRDVFADGGGGFSGVTDDGYLARFLTEKFAHVLERLGISIDAPAVEGAA